MNENNESNGFESNDSTGAFEHELETHAEATNSDGEFEAGESEHQGSIGEEASVTESTEQADSDGFQFSDDPTPEEAEALMAPEGESKTEAVETGDKGSAGNDKAKPAPAYEAFVAAVKAHGVALGLAVKEQKGFFQFRKPATDQRLYIAKQGRGVTRIDTTLPRAALVVNGKDISLPLTKDNGKIECHVDPTVESVTAALTILAGYEAKVRAAKTPTKAA